MAEQESALTSHRFAVGTGYNCARAPERQSARAPERQSARAPERQSARAPERQSARAPERQSARAPERQSARAPERQSAKAPERQSGPVRPRHGNSDVSVPTAASRAAGCDGPERLPAADGRHPPSRLLAIGLAARPGRRPSPPASRCTRLAHVCRAAACLVGLAAPGFAGAATAQDAPRLLTGMGAEAGPAGVRLTWAVDESRADRIAGFTCVYRTPGHLETGAPGSVACAPEPSPAGARALTVAGLPEYGEYLFELVALTGPGPGIPWPLRALQARVAVTEELAGAASPGRAVTGTGPLVESCRPAATASRRPWRLDEIVSAAHLTHFPGRGWGPAGDPAAPPEWPEPTPLPALVAAAGLDAGPVRQALAGEGMDREALARTLADERFAGAVARAGLGTKALLRRGRDGGHELRLHSSYPFGDDYAFGAAHAVPGWGDDAHPALRPALWNRTDCPPAGRPNAIHDVALALADEAGGGRRLAHAGYGWWAVAPVGMSPERIVATQGGLSFGVPASGLPGDGLSGAGARWTGRLAGHLFWDRRRWAVAGEVSLELLPGGTPRLSGRVENLALAPVDAKTLESAAGPGARLPALALGAGRQTEGAGPSGAWSGALTLETAGAAAGEALAGFPAAGAFRGDWLAALHGPVGAELAGRLRLWTPLPAGADPSVGWPGQAVLVAGFGAARGNAP